jgi:hypothetical protein
MSLSFHSVSKLQRSNGAVSSYRLISKVISAKFHRAEWLNLTADAGVLYFFHDAETAVSHSPLLGLCHDNRKIVLSGQKPILAVLWLAWASVWQRWHVAAHWPLQLPGTRRKLRQPITFEKVRHTSWSHTLLEGTAVWCEIIGWPIATTSLDVVYWQ